MNDVAASKYSRDAMTSHQSRPDGGSDKTTAEMPIVTVLSGAAKTQVRLPISIRAGTVMSGISPAL